MPSSRVELQLPRNPLGRVLASGTVTALSLGMCLIYVWPVPLARRALDASTVNIVRFLEHCLGAVWPLAFGAATLGLLVALFRPGWLAWAHAVAFTVWAGYSSAVTFGAIASGSPVVALWLAWGVTGFNYSLIVSYSRVVIIKGVNGGGGDAR